MHPLYTYIPEKPNVPSYKIKQEILKSLNVINMVLCQRNLQATLIFDDYYLNLFDSLFTSTELTLMRFVLKEKLHSNRETSKNIFAVYIYRICQDFYDPNTKKIPSIEQVKQRRQQTECCFYVDRWYNTYQYKGMFILTDKLIDEQILEETGLGNILSGQYEIISGYNTKRFNFIQIYNQSYDLQFKTQEEKIKIQQEESDKNILTFLQNEKLQSLKVYVGKYEKQNLKLMAENIQNTIGYIPQIPQSRQNYLFIYNRNKDPLEIFKISEKFGPFVEQFYEFTQQTDKLDLDCTIMQGLFPYFYLMAKDQFFQAQKQFGEFCQYQQEGKLQQVTFQDSINNVLKTVEIVDNKKVSSIELLENMCSLQNSKFIPIYKFMIEIIKSNVMRDILKIQDILFQDLTNVKELRKIQNEQCVRSVTILRYICEESQKNKSDFDDVKYSFSLLIAIQLLITYSIALQDENEFSKQKNEILKCIDNYNLYVGNNESRQKVKDAIQEILKYVKEGNGFQFYTNLMLQYKKVLQDIQKSQKPKTGLFSKSSTQVTPKTQSSQTQVKYQQEILPSLIEVIVQLLQLQQNQIINQFFEPKFEQIQNQQNQLQEKSNLGGYSQYYEFCKASLQKNSYAGERQLGQYMQQYQEQYDKTRGATLDEIATAQSMSQEQDVQVGFFNVGQVSSGHEVIIISEDIISAKQFVQKYIQK